MADMQGIDQVGGHHQMDEENYRDHLEQQGYMYDPNLVVGDEAQDLRENLGGHLYQQDYCGEDNGYVFKDKTNGQLTSFED